jgi:hypothetical protein
VFRLPQVWFYARSLVYVRLLAEWLRVLRRDDRIANAWQIAVSYSESGLDTAFSLEPDSKGAPRIDLLTLQSDTLTMADCVGPDIRQSARRYFDRYASGRAVRDGASSAPRRRARLKPRP